VAVVTFAVAVGGVVAAENVAVAAVALGAGCESGGSAGDCDLGEDTGVGVETESGWVRISAVGDGGSVDVGVANVSKGPLNAHAPAPSNVEL
jgi:hypothetical protein